MTPTGKLIMTLHDGTFIEATLTHEGLILDQYDEHGEECLQTAGATFDELDEALT